MKTRSVNELNGIIAIWNETHTHIHHNHRQVPPMEYTSQTYTQSDKNYNKIILKKNVAKAKKSNATK
ncbi:hypothetical protein DERF_005705 [Dermatophagoides farinae]|uniref:Uncharacterized protein n=1 Tax=Dermatophagoides farinae TaxID=6954 RepID=A0A922L8Y6_DERFA|nr:hypothetical protein DERF_005705 [Dermatophagoides farinae]